MENINTWADFVALDKEELDALTPEEVETLKSTITDNEAKLVTERDVEITLAKELANNYKIRAEKAEKSGKKGVKEEKEGKEPSVGSGYSLQDIRALNDVPDEDVDEISNYAKFKDITIAEAKKTSVMQTLLKERAEERKTASATDTKGGRPNTKVTGEALLEKANQGWIPEKDSDIEKLAEARMEAKLKK